MFVSAVIVAALGVSSAFGASIDARLADRVARRTGQRISRPINRITNSRSNSTNAQLSSNWAGAVFDNTAANTWKTVTGTITIPTPSVPSGGSSRSSFAASAWVGIDGDTCQTAILQTGVDFTISNGRVSYAAWFEYFPAAATDFTGITIHAGDSVKMTVTAASTTSGTATIENLTTGQTVSKNLTSRSKLCLENAEWIVEDFEEGGSLVPFANFGTVTFTGASATSLSGAVSGPSGADLIDIEQNNVILTSASVGSSSVTVTYT